MNQQDQTDHILQTFALFSIHDAVLEIRALKVGKYKNTASGYFDDSNGEKFAAAVQHLAVTAPKGIYTTLNPVHPDLLSRYANRLEMKAGATTTDADILRRRWILIDADPQRRAEISSTDAEHDAALAVATDCRNMLQDTFGIASVLADSGNGGHVLIPCDLPNNAEGQKIVCGVLSRMAAMFDTAKVKIDTGVHNASRICKVYGTLARKGDSTPERPHRYGRLIDVPTILSPAPLEILRELCEEEEKSPATPSTSTAPRSAKASGSGPAPFDVRAFIDRHGIEIHSESNGSGDWHHWNLERCPFNPEHNHPDSIIAQNSAGALNFKCLHNSCQGYRWQDLRQKFEPEWTPFDPNRTPGARSLQATRTTMRPEMPAYGGESPPPPRGITEKEEEILRQRSLDSELSEYPLTDTGNAERLIRRFGHDLRYCTEFKQWIIWDGRRWKRDTDGAIIRYAKKTVRAIIHEGAEVAAVRGAEAGKAWGTHAIKSESTDKLYAMVKNASTEEGIPCSVNDLDKEHFLLPVANGLLNLKTGELSPHDRRVLNTKMVNIVYNPDATCPLWERFLHWAMGGNEDNITFLQRAVGYTLTGDTSQHCWFMLYGKGENGKSTFTDTIQRLMGGSEEYFQKASAETFLKDDRPSGGKATPQIAKLAGARLVTVTEMPTGNRMNEHLLKDIVSGDILPARFLNENEFSFKPCCKLWWYGNDKPGIRGTDDGIWRRLRFVPFNQKVKPEEKDGSLGEKLAAELAGILSWAVRGYLDLLQQPNAVLVPSHEVEEATNALRDESDSVGVFIRTQCDVGPEYQEFGGALHEAYKLWHVGAGTGYINGTLFGKELDKKGFKKSDKRHRSGVIRLGIRIKPDDSPSKTPPESVYSSGKVHSCAGETPVDGPGSLHVGSNMENYTQLYTQDQNYTQTVHSKAKSVQGSPLLLPYVAMIQAAKEKNIPVRPVRVGSGVCENLNVWVNIQAKKFTESEDEEDQAETLEELGACYAAWCGLTGEEQTP